MDRVALDTTFLIDLQNERRKRGAAQGATAFLEAHRGTQLFLPSVALGEYLEGFEDVASEQARALVTSLRVLDVTPDVARQYARVTRQLRTQGRLIGTNDLWIACTAKAFGLPIVTRSVDQFSRVPELTVVAYATQPAA
jgi:tRNA(fMet)-specific endonuclease VapC